MQPGSESELCDLSVARIEEARLVASSDGVRTWMLGIAVGTTTFSVIGLILKSPFWQAKELEVLLMML